MQNLLTDQIKEEFYITIYFNISQGYENAGLKRAYLDFNRTLKIKDGDQKSRDTIQADSQDYLKKELLKLISKNISNQDEFDTLHKTICDNIISKWPELTYGHAQKWVNMTLKYWLLFGNSRITSIDKNYRYFHIPVDSYVLTGMFEEKYPKPWSKIDNYDTYLNYQKKHRVKETGNPPIIDEFEFFNKHQR